ncbi:Nitrogen assimilation transcription factor nirA [Talaromyces islandicus]|uniref:Nitrogen assimilation transcription factor nirA n=1 Tax=Talaromyces islandicus TaxID=28573 RepID=A0A0U1M6N7_TALIS|nr:Nitrogen assimilation transcription factor nirA [Talaromyces islandicus]
MQASELASPRVSQMLGDLSHITKDVMLDAFDTYFLYCHNKPYYVCEPNIFRRKLAQGQIPVYLQLALLASAIRYSSHPHWKWQRQAAIDNNARYSWAMIMSSPEALTDVSAIQALALLTIVDAIAGRRRAAWVKIGIAIRVSQSIDMMLEPSADLPDAEKNEQRHIFWSLYMLDNFVCCSFQRPPAMKNSDCLVYLPADPQQQSPTPLTLNALLDVNNTNSVKNTTLGPGWFGISVGIVAVLGKAVRCMMSNSDSDNMAPWNAASEYSAIHASLDHFRDLAFSGENIIMLLNQVGGGQNAGDHERSAHVILSYTVYHLAHCILDHPFLRAVKTLRSHQDSNNDNVPPPSWVAKSLAFSLGHACSLTKLLVDAKSAGYVPIPSFYSYCMMVAGSIHALHFHSTNNHASSAEYLQHSMQYFINLADIMNESPTLADALRRFTNGCRWYSEILLSCDEQDVGVLSASEKTILKSMVDYWVVMNPNNLMSSLQPLQLETGKPPNDENNTKGLLEAMSETSPAFMQSQQYYLPNSIGDHIFDSTEPEGLLGFEGAAGLPLNADDFSEFLRATPLASPSPGPRN